MTEKGDDQLAVQRFVEYIQVKTVQPEPDYDGAMIFLKKYAQELGLDYSVIVIDEGRQAAVLTVGALCLLCCSHANQFHLHRSGPRHRRRNRYCSILILMWCPCSKNIGSFRRFPGKFATERSTDVEHKTWNGNSIRSDVKKNQSLLSFSFSVGIQYLEAIRRLKKAKYQPKRTIHCLFVPDEEIGGARGMKQLMTLNEFKALNVGFVLDEGTVTSRWRKKRLLFLFIHAGLASETDVYQVYYGDRSGIWIDFILRGNTGHGSRLIENTVGEKAQFIMNEMLAYRTREKQRLEENQNTGENLQLGNITTINLTIIAGGVQINVVPDQFKVTFDCRIKPGGYDEFKEFLADVVRRTPKQKEDEVKINYIQDGGDVVLTNIDTPSWWLKSIKKTFTDLQCKQNWTVFPAGTDSRYLRGAGYPAIGFSPIIHTPILLHDHNEYLPQDVFLRGIGIYVQLIENLTNGVESD